MFPLLVYFCLTIIVLFLSYAYLFRKKTPDNFPPGPKGLPVLGNLHQMGKRLPEVILAMSKIYGPTVGLRLGSTPMVILHDPVTVRKVFNDENVTGRPQNQVLNLFFQGRGLVFSEGKLWKEHRRFALSTLRNLGMGKSWLEEAVLEEVQEVLDRFTRQNGASFNPRHDLIMGVSNLICAMVFGQRFDHSDDRIVHLVALMTNYFQLANQLLAVQVFPILKDIPGIRLHQRFKQFMANLHEIEDFTRKMISDHRAKKRERQLSTDKLDYITAYYNQGATASNSTMFDDEQLIFSVVNLLVGGSESTTSTILWCLVHLVRHPEIQQNIHAEIGTVTDGEFRLITLADRSNLPYTDAALHDIQRLSILAPLSLPHRTYEHMQIDGYDIPAGTCLYQNRYAMSRDTKYWAKPDDFHPEHFLDPRGKLVMSAAYMPFSAGKRTCIGESLANMETFLFFVNLVQAFEITGDKSEAEKVMADMTLALINSPPPFNVQFLPRQK